MYTMSLSRYRNSRPHLCMVDTLPLLLQEVILVLDLLQRKLDPLVHDIQLLGDFWAERPGPCNRLPLLTPAQRLALYSTGLLPIPCCLPRQLIRQPAMHSHGIMQ